jgi:hypothetical protein
MTRMTADTPDIQRSATIRQISVRAAEEESAVLPRLLRKSLKHRNSARRCRCRAVYVDRSIAVSHGRSFCDGHVIGVFDQWVHFPEIPEQPKKRPERLAPVFPNF